MTLRRARRDERVLRPVRPNLGIEADYRRRLKRLIDEMNASVLYWVRAAYRANEPEISQLADAERPPVLAIDELPASFVTEGMATDEVPANELRTAMRRLARRWQSKFDEAAPELAKFFGRSIHKRTDASLRKILKNGGWSVEFRMTPAQRDALNATIAENVNLIKSIPSQYLTQVQGMVMRSVQVGGDLETLSKGIQKQFGVTKRRAQFIASDQNNKATAVLTRSRQLELGIKQALWLHSHAGKVPRPTHLKNDGKKYDVAKGWYDPAVKLWIHPGQLPRCRCISRSIVPGIGAGA